MFKYVSNSDKNREQLNARIIELQADLIKWAGDSDAEKEIKMELSEIECFDMPRAIAEAEQAQLDEMNSL